MEMRAIRENVYLESRAGSVRSQAVVEGEITLPGGLREEARVLHAGAMAYLNSVEASQDRVTAAGRVTFHALYTQGDPGKVCAMEATADFSHMMDVPGAQPRMACHGDVTVEHVEATASGGRLMLRAVLLLCARVAGTQPVSALTGVTGAEGLQIKTQEVALRRTVATGEGETLLREEFALPESLRIRETLCGRAVCQVSEVTGGMGRVGVGGTVQLEIYHASDLPGKPLVVTRHTAPFLHAVETAGEDGEMLSGQAVVKDVAVASQEGAEGERTLRVEVLLGVTAHVDRREKLTLLQDAYTTSGEALALTTSSVQYRVDDASAQAAESGRCMLMLPEGSPAARTMLCAFVTPVMTGREQHGGRLTVEGMLEVALLYMTDDSPAPVTVRQEEPFRLTFAAEAAEEDAIALTVWDTEAAVITSDRIEVKYVMHLTATGSRTASATLVTDAAPVDAPEPARGVALCFPQPGETLWDIAKRYRVPLDTVKSMNPGAEEGGSKGVVVWRRCAAE